MTDYIVDIETDGIEATKIHCMSIHNGERIRTLTTYADMQVFIATVEKDDRIIGHNFIRYDAPIIERILELKIPCQIVDTLALSWYLYPEHRQHGYKPKHGLAHWGERFGVPKPVVEDWENACLETYVHRCEEDVKINYKLWRMQSHDLNGLYNNEPERLIKYLMFKMQCAQLQEQCKWKLDVDKANSFLEQLEQEYKELADRLIEAMPEIPIISKRKRPAKPYKKDGTLSKTGEAWEKLCKINNLPLDYGSEIEVITGWKKPNPASTLQVKDWLFSIGWKPKVFEFRRNAANPDEGIPQIKDTTGELCSSIVKLKDEHPSVESLERLTTIKSRISVVKGFLRDADSSGFLRASVGGFTNTLRFTHRVCVNLPSERKLYGLEVRELLTVSDSQGNTLCGSDLSSLEDRTKQHFMWQYDPEFVREMQVHGFDPHLDLALSAGAVTPEQVQAYKDGTDKSISEIRHAYKGGNYACTYGSGAKTLARQLGCKLHEADKIHKAYWRRNWSLRKIRQDAKTKNYKGGLWLYNPISKLWYSLRAEKDIFSTLNQGSGTYCFDMWLGFILKERKQLTAQFHDEIILEVKESEKEDIQKLLQTSLQKVNNLLKLNRELDCDVQFGKNYSLIH